MIQILRWMQIDTDDPDTFPKTDDYIILSFENWSLTCIGRYEDGAFYEGDDDKPLVKYGLFVNAWAPMIQPYREESDSGYKFWNREKAINYMYSSGWTDEQVRMVVDAISKPISALSQPQGDLISRAELLKQPMDKANYPSNYVKIAKPIIEADKEQE